MYKAVINVFDLISQTNLELHIEIYLPKIFETEEEAEKEANDVKRVMLQKNPLSLKVFSEKNEYIIDDKSLIFRRVKEESIGKIMLNDDDFELLENFKLKNLSKYFKDKYSFQIVSYGIEKAIIPIDEFHHHYPLEFDETIQNLKYKIYENN